MKKITMFFISVILISFTAFSEGVSLKLVSEKITQNYFTQESRYKAIFKWVASNISYDTSAKLLKNISTDPDSVLKYRTSVCSGYAKLYEALCESAGLKCQVINGMAKGFNYLPGDSFEVNHAWNAIFYSNKWHLVDVTWASG
ncbi:MAG: transglutaminase domain-containing protein, partial [Lentimicrobiaceae bacterium]|nr:transglutaminase domain-containing protein [Lentimicrobiaceae bacterium]